MKKNVLKKIKKHGKRLKYVFYIRFTQKVEKATYAKKKITFSVLIKSKRCFSLKSKLYKSNFFNSCMLWKKLPWVFDKSFFKSNNLVDTVNWYQ